MRRFAANRYMSVTVGNDLVTNRYLTKNEQWRHSFDAHLTKSARSAFETADQLGPTIEGWQRFFRRLGGQADDDPGNPLVAIALQPVDRLADPPDGDRHAGRVAPGLGRHLPELRQEIGDILVLRPA